MASPTLIGTWTSSRELTMAFAREHARLEARTENFLNQLGGRLTLRFDADKLAADFPDFEAEVGGIKRHLEGYQDVHPYKVLFADDASVVVQSSQAFTGKQAATVYHFVDDNTMWIYCGSSGKGMPDLNIREYFVRVK